MIDLDPVYTILTAVARRRRQLSYEELSDCYCALTKQWHEPLASWRQPLAELNQLLNDAGLPALAAVVVIKSTGEPARGFWGSSPNIPAQPGGGLARTVAYGKILQQVYAAHWPKAIPLVRAH